MVLLWWSVECVQFDSKSFYNHPQGPWSLMYKWVSWYYIWNFLSDDCHQTYHIPSHTWGSTHANPNKKIPWNLKILRQAWNIYSSLVYSSRSLQNKNCYYFNIVNESDISSNSAFPLMSTDYSTWMANLKFLILSESQFSILANISSILLRIVLGIRIFTTSCSASSPNNQTACRLNYISLLLNEVMFVEQSILLLCLIQSTSCLKLSLTFHWCFCCSKILSKRWTTLACILACHIIMFDNRYLFILFEIILELESFSPQSKHIGWDAFLYQVHGLSIYCQKPYTISKISLLEVCLGLFLL